MSKLIKERNQVKLSELQLKMVNSGWGYDAAYNSIVEKITYSSDGLNVKGFIAHPKKITKKLSCLIWCRGGFKDAGKIDSFNAQGILGQLASWGYVVLAPQYRGNDGGEGNDEFGGEDVNDVLNLISVANELEFADTSIWGIEGWSRGGMMAYLALTKTNIFKTAVITGGIADLRCTTQESPFIKNLYQKYISEINSNEFETICDSRSIVKLSDQIPPTTSMLIMHGANDTRVPAKDSLDISNKLLEKQHNFKLVLFENGDHFLKFHRKEVDQLRKEWYLNNLK